MTRRNFYVLLFLLVLAARLCHTGIVWVEEGYPLAAAREMLHGQWLYRDIWFDKPPLFASAYLLWGATHGLPLRLAGALFVLLCAFTAGHMARQLWGDREERFAAALMAFSLTFWIPAAVMVLGPDLLLIPIQLAAVLAAWQGRPLLSGVLSGAGLLVNGKMLFFLPLTVVWRPAYFAGLLATQLLLLPVAGDYWKQVWAWGALYSRDTFVTDAWREGLQRSANWAGFHLAIIAGAGLAWRTAANRWRWALWLALATLGVVAGLRFFPRYYLLLLPPVVLLAARTFASKHKWLLLLLLIPTVRFGPKFLELAADLSQHREHRWKDLAMEQDSRAAAAYIMSHNHGGTLLVWGYRPEIFVLSAANAGTPFLDSQPLTGVLADRHLVDDHLTAPAIAAANRQRLLATHPEWLVDGLGPYNPRLAITQYPDLRTWLADYDNVFQTPGSIVYRRRIHTN